MSSVLPKSVTFVSQNYFPEPIGSAPYITDMAEYLAIHGVRVDVLTARPNYPTGKVQEGYRRGERDQENRNGVSICRLAPWRPDRRGAAGRLASEGTFLLQGLARVLSGRVRRRSVVVALCPSIFAVMLGRLMTSPGGRCVAIVHDVQSGLAAGLKMVGGRFLVTALQTLERIVLNRVDRVLVLSESMRDRLVQIGVKRPIYVVPIWIDTKVVAPVDEDENVPECGHGARDVRVMYSGNMGRKQALDQILDMAECLRDRGRSIELLFRGAGGERDALQARAEKRALSNTRFEDLTPPDRLAEGLSQADIHLVPQHSAVADFAVPSKIYAIMAVGRPFVAAAPAGSYLWRLAERSKGFLCVPSGDGVAIADAVEHLAQDPDERAALGRAARSYVVAEHDRQRVLDAFVRHVSA